MTNQLRFNEAARVFEACRECRGPERLARLRELCGEDEALRLEVEDLLSAHDDEEDLVRTGGAGRAAERLTHEPPPARIGRYRVGRLLGAGGMGAVYLASQESPRRDVALKVLPRRSAPESMRRRFEHEAQALGRLDHPNIAQIFEAGVEPDEHGAPRPYFAMELVTGRPLTEAATSMSTVERLRLLATVCDAVQHAHQRGVIHRDLKPSNILVSDAGEPRVLDFGVARLTGPDDEALARTTPGQIIGTAQYMSPEQASGDPDRIDARSDVYSLGVLAYEALAGRPPYDLTGSSIVKAVRIVAEQAPDPLKGVEHAFRADLDTILKRALAKEPEERYQSASELAADLRRAARHEPILAHPPSAIYQLKKFVKRNRPLVAAAALAALAMSAGTAASLVGFSRARASETLAVERLRVAENEAEKALAVREFLREMLAAANPSNTPDPDLTVRDALAAAVARLDEGALDGQPGVQGLVIFTIATTYHSIGAVDESGQLLTRAIPLLQDADEPAESASAQNLLGKVRHHQGRYAEAEATYNDAIARAQSDPRSLDIVPTIQADLANTLLVLGRHDEALAALREARRGLVEIHSEPSMPVASCDHNIAWIQFQSGDSAGAIGTLEGALEMMSAVEDELHPSVITVTANLGVFYERAQRYEESVEMQERALALRLRILGPDHPDLLFSYSGLGNVYRRVDRDDDSEIAFRDALRVISVAYPPLHPHEAFTRANLGATLRILERWDESLAEYRRASEIYTAIGEHLKAANCHENAALAMCVGEQHQQAEAEVAAAFAIYREHAPDDASRRSSNRSLMGTVLVEAGRPSEAIGMFDESWRIRAAQPEPDAVGIAALRCWRGRALHELGRTDEARQDLETGRAALRDFGYTASGAYLESSAALGAVLLSQGEPGPAAELLEDAYTGLRDARRTSQRRLAQIASLAAEACAMSGDHRRASEWNETARSHAD